MRGCMELWLRVWLAERHGKWGESGAGTKGGSQLMSHDIRLSPWISCEIHLSLALGGDELRETLSLWVCRGPIMVRG